jgi:DNA-binding MarR family transcriptional regulator
VNGVELSDETYFRLLSIRTGMRLFDRWSEQQAKAAGLTTAQHQLLLAIRGHRDLKGPTIGEVADYLLLRHHSVVGLVDRAEGLGLITRSRDDDDRRVVRLALTSEGAHRLEELSKLHVEQLRRLGTNLSDISAGLDLVQHPHGLLK